ncbi:hypothetical protein ACE1ET_10605 [Saccharicrinis sp. FJH62]|uniref:hypothetical protein n=1 Tax=Saccharicrinis sp. FJH62 TaxID=3344657 RepID=UPI0035D49B2A
MKYIFFIGFLLISLVSSGQSDNNNPEKNKKNRFDLSLGYAGSVAPGQITDLMNAYGYNDPTTGWLFNAGEIINHPKFSGPQIFVSGSYTNFYKGKSGIGGDLRYAYLGEVSGYSESKGYLFVSLHSVSAGLHYTYRPFKHFEFSLGPLLSLNAGDNTSAEATKYRNYSFGLDGKLSLVLTEGKVSFWALNAEYILMSKTALGPYETTNYTTNFTIPETQINFSTLQIGMVYGFKF